MLFLDALATLGYNGESVSNVFEILSNLGHIIRLYQGYIKGIYQGYIKGISRVRQGYIKGSDVVFLDQRSVGATCT